MRKLAPLLLVILAAGALRLAHARSVYGQFGPYFDRHEEYYESGVALGETGLFSPDAEGLEPRAWRGPLYPAFIAAVEAPFALPWPGHVSVAQALLSTMGVAAAAALAFLLGGAYAALFTALFLAFDPAQIAAVSSLNIHGFYGWPVLALACAASFAPPAVAGLSLAGSLLCRSAHFLAAPLLALAAWRGKGLKSGAALLLFAAFGLLPWTVRNAARIGGFVPLDAGGGYYSLLNASQGGLGAMSVTEALDLAEELRPGFGARHPGEALREPALRALAYEEISRRPWVYLGGCFKRLFVFWLPLWPFVLLAIPAFFKRKADDALVAVGCVALSFSAYAAIGVHPAYELGVAPVLAVLAGCGAASFLKPYAAPAQWKSWARKAALAWAGLFLALSAGVSAWSLVDATRAGAPSVVFMGPRVLSVLRNGSVISGGRWHKSVKREELLARPLRNEGVRLFRAGRVEEALKAFEAAVAASPRGAEDRLNLCVALGGLGRRKEALPQCDRAVELARKVDEDLYDSAVSTRDSLRITRQR